MVNILQVVGALVVLGMRVVGYGENGDSDDDDEGLYEKYNDEDETSLRFGVRKSENAPARNRRDENKTDDSVTKDLEDVKGALKEILSGRNVEELFSIQSEDSTTLTHSASRKPTRIRSYYTSKMTDSSSTLDQIDNTTTQREGKVETETPNVEETLKIDDENKRQNVTNITDQIVQKGIVRTYNKSKSKIQDLGPLRLRKNKGADSSTTSTTNNCPTTTTTSTTTTTTEPPPDPHLDIPALLDIISNFRSLTHFNHFYYDWLDKLTKRVNATLQKKGIPTCSPPARPEEYGENMTGTIMAKCFVCGLVDRDIPHNAHCADAFAGDFLPLVPVDPTARSQIGQYRKYCRYSNTANQYINASDPKAVWARWTGGCAVRWTDLTGVYTQRVCRIRYKPVLGKHFASKRMAKLEMALQHVDDGCIISPMATLLPLSRAISLFARFHACVCSGPWCNGAIANQQCTVYIVIVSIFFIVRSIDYIL